MWSYDYNQLFNIQFVTTILPRYFNLISLTRTSLPSYLTHITFLVSPLLFLTPTSYAISLPFLYPVSYKTFMNINFQHLLLSFFVSLPNYFGETFFVFIFCRFYMCSFLLNCFLTPQFTSLTSNQHPFVFLRISFATL